jgi:hypothetical protein
MTRFSLSLVATFAIQATAYAEGTATPSSPVEDPQAPPFEARKLRDGLHYGFSIGGAYLPLGGGVSVGVARLDLNVGRGWIEHRFSPIVYRASGDNTILGVGAVYEERIPIGEVFAFGGGLLLAYESTDDGSTSAIGVTFSPVTLRLGERRNYEVGINALLVREPQLGNQNFGAYLSFSYLKI